MTVGILQAFTGLARLMHAALLFAGCIELHRLKRGQCISQSMTERGVIENHPHLLSSFTGDNYLMP